MGGGNFFQKSYVNQPNQGHQRWQSNSLPSFPLSGKCSSQQPLLNSFKRKDCAEARSMKFEESLLPLVIVLLPCIEGSRILADVYISLYVFIHFYIFLCVFAYVLHVFVHISWLSNLGPTWGQHGPNLSQLGANLGPSWVHIGSSMPTWSNLEASWGIHNLRCQNWSKVHLILIQHR